MPQTNGPAFICSSETKLGDIIAKLQRCRASHSNKHIQTLSIGKELRQQCFECKSQHGKENIEMSHNYAYHMVPNYLYNFCCAMINSSVPDDLQGPDEVLVDKKVEEKAVLMAQ